MSEEDILKRLRGYPAANDRRYIGIEEKHILERARVLAAFIKGDAGLASAVVRKAKTKFGILGEPTSWGKEQFEAVDQFVDLSIFTAAQSDLLSGQAGKELSPEVVTKSVHAAMDQVARAMPQMIGK